MSVCLNRGIYSTRKMSWSVYGNITAIVCSSLGFDPATLPLAPAIHMTCIVSNICGYVRNGEKARLKREKGTEISQNFLSR